MPFAVMQFPSGFMIMKPAPERKSVKVQHYAAVIVGLFVLLKNPPLRNERGLSQSAENAILLAGAVTVAGWATSAWQWAASTCSTSAISKRCGRPRKASTGS